MLRDEEGTLLKVKEQYCIGCGICAKLSPDNFILENKKAKVIKAILKLEESDKIKASINKCPAKAIGYEK